MCRRQSPKIQAVARKADRGPAGIRGCQETSLWSDMPVQIYGGKLASFVKRRGMSIVWGVT